MAAPPNPQALTLLSQIAELGPFYNDSQPGIREKLLSLTHALTAAVELPSEAIQRIGWAEPARFAALKLAIDLQLFDQLAKSGDAGVGVAELATASKADPILISRTMKHLAAMNAVGEKGVDHYLATPFSTALTEAKYRDGITYLHDVANPSFHHLPAYLTSTSHAHPTNIANGPFQYAHKTPSPFFIWLYENPPLATCFNNYMSGYRAGKPEWLDPGFYPVDERLGKGMREGKEEVLLVDVGGGLGHDLLMLRQKHPRLEGRLVLQDKEEVVRQAGEQGEGKEEEGKEGKGFEGMAYDFFTEQPVKGAFLTLFLVSFPSLNFVPAGEGYEPGVDLFANLMDLRTAARAYHLHSVLHDWDDASSHTILANIAAAMEKGYSKLLINELIVPDQDANWSITSMDWLMLVLGAVKERTERNWRDLVEGAGMRVTGIWTVEQGSESLIECELA